MTSNGPRPDSTRSPKKICWARCCCSFPFPSKIPTATVIISTLCSRSSGTIRWWSKCATTVGPTKARCATLPRRTSPSAISISRMLGKAVAPSAQVTSHVGYVRLHGRNYEQWFDSDSGNDRYNYLYTQPELEKWKSSHRHHRRQGAEDVCCNEQSLRGQSRSQCASVEKHVARRIRAGSAKFAQPLLGVERNRVTEMNSVLQTRPTEWYSVPSSPGSSR